MTVLSLANRNDYIGSGTTGPFAYGFKILADTDLLLTRTEVATGIPATLVLGSDYSVTGVGAAIGGTVTLTDSLLSGFTLTIRRVRPLLQSTDLRNQGRYYADTVEDAFDRATMVDQQLNEALSGTVRLPESINPATFDPTLPVSLPAGTAVVVNGAGTGFSMATLSSAQLSPWSASQNQKLDVFTSAHGDFTPGTTTALTLTAAPGNVANLIILRRTSGATVVYESDEYSVVGQTLTFSVAIPTSTTRVEVRYFLTYQINIAQAENVDTSFLGTGAVIRNVRDVLRGTLRAADFGVVGDGSTDDTVNFQKALTAGAAQNKIVDGESLTIKVTAGVTCAGPGLVFNAVTHGNAGGPGILISGTGYTALTVTGIVCAWRVMLYGAGNTANGVYFNNPILGHFAMTRVFNLDGFGVKIDRCYDCVFDTISVEQCGNTSVYAFSVNAGGDTSNQSVFLRVQVEQANTKAIFVDPSTLCCFFGVIHSEQATPGAGVDTWALGGSRTTYGVVFLASLAPSANATAHFNMGSGLVQNLLATDSIDVKVEASGRMAFDNVEVQGTFHVASGQSGVIIVRGGVIVSMPTDAQFLRVSDVTISTLTMGFANNPADPTLAKFTRCKIAVLASSSSLSAATFVNCEIAEGNSLLRGSTVLENTTVTCAGSIAHSSGTLDASHSRINATALVYTNHAAIRGTGTTFNAPISCGDAGQSDVVLDDGCSVGAGSSGIGVPTQGFHEKGNRHTNHVPAELGTSYAPGTFSPGDTPGKYIIDGWVCSVAGTPGTWLARRTLTGN